MAQTLEQFNFNRKGRKDKYPWDEWFDGQIWELTSDGDEPDFDCKPESLRASIYDAAKKRGVEVDTSVNTDTGTVVVRATVSV